MQIGDWFVLYQLCQNCNPYFFREFIRQLAVEIKHRPKKSKSRVSLGKCQFRLMCGLMQGGVKTGQMGKIRFKFSLPLWIIHSLLMLDGAKLWK